MQDNFITERQSRPLWNSLAFVFKLKIDSLWQSIFCCGFIKWYDLCRFGICQLIFNNAFYYFFVAFSSMAQKMVASMA